jgi:hypothetical protein
MRSITVRSSGEFGGGGGFAPVVRALFECRARSLERTRHGLLAGLEYRCHLCGVEAEYVAQDQHGAPPWR